MKKVFSVVVIMGVVYAAYVTGYSQGRLEGANIAIDGVSRGFNGAIGKSGISLNNEQIQYALDGSRKYLQKFNPICGCK